MPKPVLLWTDASVWLLLAAFAVYAVLVLRSPGLKANWRGVFGCAPALASAVVLALCLAVTLLDSVHFRSALAPASGAAKDAAPAYDVRTRSLLDALLANVVDSREKSYSRPLATTSASNASSSERVRTT